MKRLATLAASITLALPGSAAAASSTCQAYNPQLSTATSCHKLSGTLPFTGVNVLELLAGGGTLLAAGVVIRGLTRRPE